MRICDVLLNFFVSVYMYCSFKKNLFILIDLHRGEIVWCPFSKPPLGDEFMNLAPLIVIWENI